MSNWIQKATRRDKKLRIQDREPTYLEEDFNENDLEFPKNNIVIKWEKENEKISYII